MHCLTGIQEVVGSTLSPATDRNLVMNNFYSHSLPTADASWAVVSYWQKYGQLLVLVNHLGSLPGNSVDKLTDQLDTTFIVLIRP